MLVDSEEKRRSLIHEMRLRSKKKTPMRTGVHGEVKICMQREGNLEVVESYIGIIPWHEDLNVVQLGVSNTQEITDAQHNLE